MIQIKNLSKVFGNLKVLDNINISINEGEFITFIGPNGCGKTTLFNILAGIEGYEGSVMFRKKPKFSMVFQNYRDSLLPWRTVYGNIRLAHEIQGIRNREIIREYLQMLNLWKHRRSYTYNLSGGMQQKVAIARAFASNPNILLMDEPFSALDHSTRGQLELELLKIWGKSKITTLFISHDIDEAIFLADRVVVFSGLPAKIKEIIKIPLPRPRNLDVLKSNAFIRIRNKVLGMFEDG